LPGRPRSKINFQMYPKIVDAHHHLWDLSANYYPWLSDKVEHKPWGNYTSIRNDYLVSDFLDDCRPVGVVKSIHVQAGHDPSDPVRETQWLQSNADDIAKSGGFPHGIVAFADLSSPTCEKVIEAHAAYPRVWGVRQMLSHAIWDPAIYRNHIEDEAWRRNIALLGKYRLGFDFQIHPMQMDHAAEVIRTNSRMQFSICHTGMPSDQTPDGLDVWRRGLRKLSELPNVALKISGFGMFDAKWTPASIKPLITEAIEIFGTERCMFGSNYPVERLASSYCRLWEAYATAVAEFSEPEKAAIFHDTAIKFYRL
jgi:predicted TIM-barrel fold metal-dependent hydrolase